VLFRSGDLLATLLTAPAMSAERSRLLTEQLASGHPPGSAAWDEWLVWSRMLLDGIDATVLANAAQQAGPVTRRLFIQSIEGHQTWAASGLRAFLEEGQRGGRTSWVTYTAHQGTPAVGAFPASWPASARASFLLSPGVSAELNPECDAASGAFNAATCATTVAQTRAAQFLSTGATPPNAPVTP
jgi:hypothetical protein